MDQELIKKEYDELVPFHQQLEVNLKDALAGFLSDSNISYHTITSRIKGKDSYLDKIERKGYTDHKSQIEDFCGLRVICYYPEDLDNIGEIIGKEFTVLESINKSNLLEPDKFGYRSDHYIVAINEEWTKAPNYRKLKNLKAEVQVRTILMHAWADIEHKLAYKSKEQIPAQFRRQLYQLSALLEIADNQFQNLKMERDRLKESLIIETDTKEKVFDTNQELNLDTFQALLDFYFHNREKDTKDTSNVLQEFLTQKLKINDLSNYILKFNSLGINIENELAVEKRLITQSAAIRLIADIFDDEYWNKRKGLGISPSTWVPLVNKTRDSLKA